MQCASCSKEPGVFPYSCKFCSNSFCADHRLPENHSCLGLEKWKEENVQKPEEWVYKATREEGKETQSRLGGIIGKIPHKKVVAVVLILVILAGIVLFTAL